MSFDPPLAVVNTLSGQLSLTAGVNLFKSAVRAVGDDIPVNAVFVFGAPGAPPTRFMGQASEVRRAAIIVRVRWNKANDGATKARDILDYLQGRSITNYLDLAALQSEPDNLGLNTLGQYEWSMGFSLVYTQT